MIRPITLICWILMLGSGLYLYREKHEVELMDKRIVQMAKETDALRVESRHFLDQWIGLGEPGQLQKYTDQYLGLKPVAPTQFVRVSDLGGRLPAPRAPVSESEGMTRPAPEASGMDEAEAEDLPVPPIPPATPVITAAMLPAKPAGSQLAEEKGQTPIRAGSTKSGDQRAGRTGDPREPAAKDGAPRDGTARDGDSRVNDDAHPSLLKSISMRAVTPKGADRGADIGADRGTERVADRGGDDVRAKPVTKAAGPRATGESGPLVLRFLAAKPAQPRVADDASPGGPKPIASKPAERRPADDARPVTVRLADPRAADETASSAARRTEVRAAGSARPANATASARPIDPNAATRAVEPNLSARPAELTAAVRPVEFRTPEPKVAMRPIDPRLIDQRPGDPRAQEPRSAAHSAELRPAEVKTSGDNLAGSRPGDARSDQRSRSSEPEPRRSPVGSMLGMARNTVPLPMPMPTPVSATWPAR